MPWDISTELKKDFAENIASIKPYARNGGLAYFTAHLERGDIMLRTSFATILKALVISRVIECGNWWGPMSLCNEGKRLFELNAVRNDEHFRDMTDRLQQFFVMLRSQ